MYDVKFGLNVIYLSYPTLALSIICEIDKHISQETYLVNCILYNLQTLCNMLEHMCKI